MDIVQTISIPIPPSTNLGFYEHTIPTCILSDPSNARAAEITLGSYSSLTWEAQLAAIELANAVSWGTKTLPGAGAFYFANHEDGNPTMGHLEPAQHDD